MRKIKANSEDLEILKKIADDFLKKYPESLKYYLKLVIVEIFTNILKHASFENDDVYFDIEEKGDNIIFCFEYEDKEFTHPVDKFEDGMQQNGFGFYIINKLCDELKYEYDEKKKRVKVYGKKKIKS
jgi:anti-sigma regulatory factor (Ser/Thr protein kinase)